MVAKHRGGRPGDELAGSVEYAPEPPDFGLAAGDFEADRFLIERTGRGALQRAQLRQLGGTIISHETGEVSEPLRRRDPRDSELEHSFFAETWSIEPRLGKLLATFGQLQHLPRRETTLGDGSRCDQPISLHPAYDQVEMALSGLPDSPQLGPEGREQFVPVRRSA
jgi:hypothetical protein